MKAKKHKLAANPNGSVYKAPPEAEIQDYPHYLEFLISFLRLSK